ncbi:DUF4105 domain-containing protein [Aggregicoccus sp. 17bor-14]|uniref:Lnb N-terminal periplasmic domain-containing protein n=1 Tax=Myxococcaceae TaxID=31 RepID=UPI00129C8EE8|nr:MULTISPECIES: DUF4105 domain-containing protein [Myxococcaceae]MBF5041590.1 DUF4105 domain-containing protein [Simulacricoccus sp. 17bor-14]MRI87375.1 DUF4105 domain-containing protein [Aggregicoccus sp. 17bor-14]
MSLPVLLLLSALASAAPPSPPPSPSASADVAVLQQRAHAQGLARQKQWLRLGHYVKSPGGRYQSEADGLEFFLAKGGKDDPAAELDATLAALFAPPVAGKEGQHAQCRFPARLLFLAQALAVDVTHLPRVECKDLVAFWKRLDPRSVTLVFSSYYLNNPASAFGHTFLRFNKVPEVSTGMRSELLDYGVDYAGVVDTSNALLYGLKGMTGLFPGRFNHYPYFYKVREYNEYESRDLWEYELALQPQELTMLVAHLWEVGGTYFDYFYLSENCSYRILAVLEAAAPRLPLLEHLRPYVLPSETVKVVHAQPGLVARVTYRPSIRSQFRARAAGLSGRELDLVEDVAREPTRPLPADLTPERQVAVLDAALDYVDLREAKVLVHGTSLEASQTKQHLLERRSQVLRPSPPLVIPPPYERQPQRGNPNQRLAVSAGTSSRDGAFALYRFRFALRDLADPHEGYPELAQIEFVNLQLRGGLTSPRFALDELTLVRILSLTALDRFDRAPSWTARVGLDRIRDGGCPGGPKKDCYAAGGEVGGGLAVTSFGGALTLFGLSEASLHAGPHLPGLFGTGLRPALGPHVGARLRLGTRATVVAGGRYQFFFEQPPGQKNGVRQGWSADATARLHLTPALGLELAAQRHADGEREGTLGALVYF